MFSLVCRGTLNQISYNSAVNEGVQPDLGQLLTNSVSYEFLKEKKHDESLFNVIHRNNVTNIRYPQEASQLTPEVNLNLGAPDGNSSILDQLRLRSRTTISSEKVALLEMAFNRSPFATSKVKLDLSKVTGLTEKVITVWFQNKRQRIRKESSVRLEDSDVP